MKRVPATEAKAKLSELLARVAADGEPIMIERHGKAIAALVAPEDLALIEDTKPTAAHPLGGLGLIGAWDMLSDGDIDEFIEDVYAARAADEGRPVDLEL